MRLKITEKLFWSLAKKVSATRRARSQDRELRMEDRESPSSILYLSILKHTIGPFSAGSLGNGIGSTGQAQEIPDDQEQNAGKLRKRRRDMEESAT
jgi:hypothetical protein